jgi:hypothetical protein
MLCCAERGASPQPTAVQNDWFINSKESNVEGVEAHDDFASNTLGNDASMDAGPSVAGISALAR